MRPTDSGRRPFPGQPRREGSNTCSTVPRPDHLIFSTLTLTRAPPREVTSHGWAEREARAMEVVVDLEGTPVTLLGIHPLAPTNPRRTALRDAQFGFAAGWGAGFGRADRGHRGLQRHPLVSRVRSARRSRPSQFPAGFRAFPQLSRKRQPADPHRHRPPAAFLASGGGRPVARTGPGIRSLPAGGGSGPGRPIGLISPARPARSDLLLSFSRSPTSGTRAT